MPAITNHRRGEVDPLDFSERYNTKLSPQEEAQFAEWANKSGRLKDVYDYDMRGAWKAGITADQRGHLPDTFKKPNHPTFSSESQYHGADGFHGGQWQKTEDGWAFMPGQTNLQLHGADGLADYFGRAEPGAKLMAPAEQERSYADGGLVDQISRDLGESSAAPAERPLKTLRTEKSMREHVADIPDGDASDHAPAESYKLIPSLDDEDKPGGAIAVRTPKRQPKSLLDSIEAELGPTEKAAPEKAAPVDTGPAATDPMGGFGAGPQPQDEGASLASTLGSIKSPLRPRDTTAQDQRIRLKEAEKYSRANEYAAKLLDASRPMDSAERRMKFNADKANDVASQDFWRNVEGYRKTLAPQQRQMMGGALQALGDALNAEIDTRESLDENLTGQVSPERMQAVKLARMGADFYETGDLMQKEAMKGLKPGLGAQSVGMAMQSVSQMLIPMLTGAVAGGAPLTVPLIGITTAAQQYGKGRDEGLTPGQAGTYASIYGAIEALSEYTPVKALMAKDPNAARWFWNFLVKEIPNELIANGLEDALDKVSVQPEMTMADFGQDMLLTVLSTPLSAGAQAGAVRAIQGRQPAMSEEDRDLIFEKFKKEWSAYRAKEHETKGFTAPEQTSKPEPKPEPTMTKGGERGSGTHTLDDGTMVVPRTEDGKHVPGLWEDMNGVLHEADRAEPIQKPEPNATFTAGGTEYDVEVTGPGRTAGTARLADGQEVAITRLHLDDDAKARLGLVPKEEQEEPAAALKREPKAPTQQPAPAEKREAEPKAAAPASGAEPPPPRSSATPAAAASPRPQIVVEKEEPKPKEAAPDPDAVMEQNRAKLELQRGAGARGVYYDEHGRILAVGSNSSIPEAAFDGNQARMASVRMETDGTINVRGVTGKGEPLAKLRASLARTEPTEKQLKAFEKASRKAAARKQLNVDTDSLIPAIIKLGGLAPAERLDATGDTKENPSIPFVGYLFQKGDGKTRGRTIDGMAEALVEHGYLPKRDVRALADLIRAELGGKKHYSLHRNEFAVGSDEEAAPSVGSEADHELAGDMEEAAQGAPLAFEVTPEDLRAEGVEPTPASMVIGDLLSQLDEDTQDRLVMQYADARDADFIAALRKAIEEKANGEKTAGRAGRDSEGGARGEGKNDAGGRAEGRPGNQASSGGERGEPKPAAGGEAGARDGEQLREADKPQARHRLADRAEQPGAPYDDSQEGASAKETKAIGDLFSKAEDAQEEEEGQITHVFDPPAKKEIVRMQDKARIYHAQHGWMTVEQAKAKIEEWKANAEQQGKTNANGDKIVLSLFDLTGEWSKPWAEAGYQVYRYDIQSDPEHGDVNKFSTEFFNDVHGAFEGQDIYAILAACPCTDFAVSGAKHFAAKDADGRTIASVQLVRQTLATIEFFKPAVWALENPVGRIEKLTGLPPWRLSFDPNHFGDTYTKKTLFWGRFNADLPVAPVEPIEGSKMWAKYGGKSQATKNARSVTPEGVSYAFFQANNAIDNPVMAIANKYDRLDRGVIDAAVKRGVTEEQISDAIDDDYYIELDDDAANEKIAKLQPVDAEPKAPEYDLTKQTEAELAEKAAAIAKAEAEKAKLPPEKRVTVDQADMFNTQGSLFQALAGYNVSIDMHVADTGAMEKTTVPAVEALREVDKALGLARSMLECLRS